MKEKNRKSANDYAADYKTAVDNVNALECRITDRLMFLCKHNPDVPVVILNQLTGKSYNAKSLGNKFYIETLPVKTRIDYIRIIETYLSNLVAVQTEINFK